jgi:hypothetical protein
MPPYGLVLANYRITVFFDRPLQVITLDKIKHPLPGVFLPDRPKIVSAKITHLLHLS